VREQEIARAPEHLLRRRQRDVGEPARREKRIRSPASIVKVPGPMIVWRDVQRHLRLSRNLQAAWPDELLRHVERGAVEREAEQGMSRR